MLISGLSHLIFALLSSLTYWSVTPCPEATIPQCFGVMLWGKLYLTVFVNLCHIAEAARLA